MYPVFIVVWILMISELCNGYEEVDNCDGYAYDPLGYPEVNTTSGIVTGVTTTKSHIFWNIPYAQPPVGNLRFQPPEPLSTPLKRVNGTRKIFVQCHQLKDASNLIYDGPCPYQLSEDCLILNVFVPSSVDFSTSGSPSERLPVLFFIHGGSLKVHSGNQPRHNATDMANVTNAIVVTINYRLGPLGFLLHHQTGKPDMTGNQGFKDQQLAMKWVQDNIDRFGGDKERVTIFGNSAGAQSVMFHTISNISRNLFANAIQQSNAAALAFYAPTREMAAHITDRLTQSLGCGTDQRKCLMDASAEAIINCTTAVETKIAQEKGTAVYLSECFQIIIDGEEFTDQPMNLYRDGKWSTDKNMIIGVSTEEFEHIEYSYPKDFKLNAEMFMGLMSGWFDLNKTMEIGEKYGTKFGLSIDGDFNDIFWKIYSHFYFNCPSRLMARLAAETTSSSVYFYVDDRKVLVDSCVELNEGNTTGCHLSYHATEIEYVFRSFEEVRADNYTAADVYIENVYSTYWGNFARTGDPSNTIITSNGEYPIWPKYEWNKDPSKGWSNLLIRAPSSTIQNYYEEELCDFWDSIGYLKQSVSRPVIDVTRVEPTVPVTTTSSGNRVHVWYNLCYFLYSFVYLYSNML